MRIFRVEHSRFNHGPYNREAVTTDDCLDLAYKLVAAHNNDESRPSIKWDIEQFYQKTYKVCGFDSLDSLYQWFNGWLDKLQACGYVIKVFETDDFDLGKSGLQLIFNRNEPIEVIELL